MTRIDDPASIDTLLRHPAFADRAVLEKALSGRFFAPFLHQEVVTGPAFEARARFSRAALGGVTSERVRAAAGEAASALLRPRTVPSLLDDVRRTTLRATIRLVLGRLALEDLALAAVTDIDRGIKMIGRANAAPRRALAEALRVVLSDPDAWPPETYLEAGRSEALALPIAERVDHVAAVFLATGTIQVSDVVTHALIALAQYPAARDATDDAIIGETIRVWPVNSSVTRHASADATIAGRCYRRGQPVTVIPEALVAGSPFAPSRRDHVGTWSFGAGPRACPARRVALILSSALLGHYRRLGVEVEAGYPHRRSLALEAGARIGPGAPPRPAGRARRAAAFARYAAVCLESYPRAFLHGLPELARVIAERA